MSSTGVSISIDQPALTIDVSDVEAVVAAGNFHGISLDTLNVQGSAGQGAFRHVHDQPSASTVWVIDHNLGGYPNVTVIGLDSVVLFPSIEWPSPNRVVITHAAPYAGQAFIS